MPERTIDSGALPTSDSSAQEIAPLLARSKPEIVRRSVLLPAPLAPITVVIFPSVAVKETPSSARTAPYSVTKFSILSMRAANLLAISCSAEIGRNYGRIAFNGIEITASNYFAEVKNIDLIRNFANKINMVLNN